VQILQLAPGHILNVRGQSGRPLSAKDLLGLGTRETDNHHSILPQRDNRSTSDSRLTLRPWLSAIGHPVFATWPRSVVPQFLFPFLPRRSPTKAGQLFRVSAFQRLPFDPSPFVLWSVVRGPPFRLPLSAFQVFSLFSVCLSISAFCFPNFSFCHATVERGRWTVDCGLWTSLVSFQDFSCSAFAAPAFPFQLSAFSSSAFRYGPPFVAGERKK
jgi:hypothetical protein